MCPGWTSPHCPLWVSWGMASSRLLFSFAQDLINKAINAALAARKEWDLKPVQDRAQIFLKAADMLSGPRRAEVLAKTMVGQVSRVQGANKREFGLCRGAGRNRAGRGLAERPNSF